MLRTLMLGAVVLLAGCTQPDTTGVVDDEPAASVAERLAALQDAWFCLTPVEVDDLNTTAVGGVECRLSVDIERDLALIYATGIPNHDFESGPGCCAGERAYTWRIPLQPTRDMDGELEAPPTRGPIGVALNGVPIYGPEDGPGGDAVANHHGVYEDDRQPIWLGLCHGHSAGTQFHYHADAGCMYWEPGPAQTWNDYAWDRLDASGPSPLLGFAFDGYPIYGAYAEIDGEIVELRSSYKLKAGADGYNGVADYEYIAGLGDLDECNGRVAATAEFPGGTYHYVSTMRNGDGDLGFPYFINCYHGEPETTNYEIVPGTEGLLGRGGLPPGQ